LVVGLQKSFFGKNEKSFFTMFKILSVSDVYHAKMHLCGNFRFIIMQVSMNVAISWSSRLKAKKSHM
jgi:hypothetical protein